MSAAIVIPTLGGPTLGQVCAAVASLRPRPDRVVVVVSGAAAERPTAPGCEVIRSRRRLGFAAAVNQGLARVLSEHDRVAVLNDDAVPAVSWLGSLSKALDADRRLAAVQGTLSDSNGGRVDGRGITLDRWLVPVQVDRDRSVEPEPEGPRQVIAVSGTAALFRSRALLEARLPGSNAVLDSAFGCYHEDLDLGLRLGRLGWGAAWVAGAPCRHLGSVTGARLRWRHPWWILVNRWRALAGNATPAALLAALPRMLRGEVRAVATLARSNPRALAVAAAALVVVPAVAVAAARRWTPGPRLTSMPGARP